MKLGFLGAGKMAEAILSGVLKSGEVRPGEVVACEQFAERREFLRGRYGIEAVPETGALREAEVIVLAVKPQDLANALAGLAQWVDGRHLVVSIAAGWTLARLEAALPNARVVRVMPNLPILVGAGMSAYVLGSRAKLEDKQQVRRIFACSGWVEEMPENLFDGVTALSGSGPAFFAYAMKAFASAAEARGMPPDFAANFALQTLVGTAAYLRETGQSPEDFMKAVASPKGTTEAGLNALNAAGAAEVLGKAIDAAWARSAELSKA
jgi:pyrroline-5-carboxylate reductase